MTIQFSRHAKRRAKLYKIPEEIVTKIMDGRALTEGNHEIIENVPGFKYPLKVVVSVELGTIVVITNYPLKKRREK